MDSGDKTETMCQIRGYDVKNKTIQLKVFVSGE
jgi:hypothetical protein